MLIMKFDKFDLKSVDNQILFQRNDDRSLQTFLKVYLALDNKTDFEFKVKHSKHSRKRASQRSLNYRIILTVLLLGTPFYRQGMTFYTVMRKDIPENTDHKLVDKVQNLVVVLGNNSAQVVTCYYTKNAVKYLRHKGKELKK